MKRIYALAWVLALVITATAEAAELQLGFSLGRNVYQTNETIPLHLLRQGTELAAGELVMSLSCQDGSTARYVFAVAASATPRTEHLHIDARLLRPGEYQLQIEADGATASVDFAVFSHLRKSSFRVVNWGSRAKDDQNRLLGEDGLGYNLVMQNQGRTGGTFTAEQIRAGVDWTSCCTMSGGHQMDLRLECDWSDPHVIVQGGTRRVMRDVFGNRTSGNAVGSHFYDEPGLTWWKDPVTDKMTAHMVPAQVRAYEAAFGEAPIRYNEVDPDNPEHVRRWKQWAVWKLGFMSAAWKDASWAVSHARPDYLSFTQSQYGFSAFTDGYYFNVVGSLPLVSGHGGYHDWGPGYWHPSYTLDVARARDRAKPCWYMPLWYSNSTSDETRLEQYLSFATGIQGLMTPPPMDPSATPFLPSFDGIIESNKLMLKLGTIFTTMEETHPPVAVLYSLSHLLHHQATVDMDAFYAHGIAHGKNLPIVWLAGKLRQRTFQPIVDEDVVDGTLAERHQALILTSIDHLSPEVRDALTDFVEQGGKLFISRDSTVQLPGATVIPAEFEPTAEEAAQVAAAEEALETLTKQLAPIQAKINEKTPAWRQRNKLSEEEQAALTAEMDALNAQKKALTDEMAPHRTARQEVQGMRGMLRVAERYATVLEPLLKEAGIAAAAISSEPGIGVQQHGAGDVHYTFVINATHDYESQEDRDVQTGMKAAETTLVLPLHGAVLYDAIQGGLADDFERGAEGWQAQLRFGPGQMRVYAQTAKPIGAVAVAAPILHRDLTVYERPIRLDLAASILADDNSVLSGSIPLQIRIIDPLGKQRYEFYRASALGQLRLSVPLAANDPAGDYTITVRELLGNHEGTTQFTYQPGSRVGSLAGESRRALLYDRDVENIFRFFRIHQHVTLVIGENPAYRAAAERVAAYLEPWTIRTMIVDAASVNRGKEVSEAAAPTLAGFNYTPRGSIKAGDENPAHQVGFAVEGPVILIGTPENNPLIKHINDFHLLPVKPSATGVPGAGRGLLAWQRDIIGARQESITLIAYDAAGLDEAVGHLYEVMAGLEPLTPWTLPRSHRIAPAVRADVVPGIGIAWSTVLPDKADALMIDNGSIVALTHDGSRVVLSAAGAITSSEVIGEGAVAEQASALRRDPAKLDKELVEKAGLTDYLLRDVVVRDGELAALHVGGLVRLLDVDGAVRAAHHFSDDVLSGLWLGDTLIVATSDARITALAVRDLDR